MEDMKMRKKNLLMFPLGTVGRDMIYCLVNSYLLTYIMFTRSLTAAQLAAVTAIMVAARVFDALNDPIMGNIIERTRTKWGKFKPWLVIGILLTSIVVYIVFNSKLQGWSFIWLFGGFYLSYSVAYTMHDISYWGMVPALSSDADARNQFTSRATLFAGIGSTTAAMLIPMFTTGEMALGGSSVVAYGRIALIICILAPLFLAFTVAGAQERRDDMQEAAPPISLKMVVKTITRNDQILWIALIFLLQQIGNNLIIGGLGSTYIYFDFGYSGGLYSTFNTVGMMVTALLMIFYPAISRRIHRKKLMGILAVISSVGYILMVLPGLAMGSSMAKFWIITGGYMLANFGQYGYYLIMMISIINTVEYNELEFGARDEAIIASLRPFLTKMASALVVALTSLTYIIFGVTNITNQISSFENDSAAGLITEAEKLSSVGQVLDGVAPGQTLGLLLCATLLPWALMLLSYFLYKKHYKLDEEEYERICAELAAREAKA